MNPEGLEPTISAGERQQTYAVVHAANGTDSYTLSQIMRVVISQTFIFISQVSKLNTIRVYYLETNIL